MYPKAKDLSSLFFPISTAFIRLVHDAHIVPEGLTNQQMKIIMELGMAGTLRLSELSRCAGVTHGTMTVAVKKLNEKGLLIKRKDPHDERAVSLALTKKGQTLYQQIEHGMVELFNTICDTLSKNERKQLLESYRFLLRVYQRSLDKKGSKGIER